MKIKIVSILILLGTISHVFNQNIDKAERFVMLKDQFRNYTLTFPCSLNLNAHCELQSTYDPFNKNQVSFKLTVN